MRRAQVSHPINRVVPPACRRARLGHLKPALQKALLSRGRHESILLWGGVGVGKTYAIAAYLRHLIVRSRGEIGCARVKWTDLLMALRGCYATGKGSEMDILRPYVVADLLWLEDLGAGATRGRLESELALRGLSALLDDRLEARRPTIITSNLRVEDIEKMFDQRIGSRLHTFRVLCLTGVDRRRTGGQP